MSSRGSAAAFAAKRGDGMSGAEPPHVAKSAPSGGSAAAFAASVGGP